MVMILEQRTILWHGFEVNVGMIGDSLKAASCENRDIWQAVCNRARKPMPIYLARVLHELSPAIMRFYIIFQARIAGIWHGMLTERKKYRSANAVIERVYQRVAIFTIMGRVSIKPRWAEGRKEKTVGKFPTGGRS